MNETVEKGIDSAANTALDRLERLERHVNAGSYDLEQTIDYHGDIEVIRARLELIQRLAESE